MSLSLETCEFFQAYMCFGTACHKMLLLTFPNHLTKLLPQVFRCYFHCSNCGYGREKPDAFNQRNHCFVVGEMEQRIANAR